MPCKDEGRSQGDASTSQGRAKIASKPPEAKRGTWNEFFLTALRGNQHCQYLDIDFQTPELQDKFLLFKPPSLWYFVIAALAN